MIPDAPLVVIAAVATVKMSSSLLQLFREKQDSDRGLCPWSGSSKRGLKQITSPCPLKLASFWIAQKGEQGKRLQVGRLLLGRPAAVGP